MLLSDTTIRRTLAISQIVGALSLGAEISADAAALRLEPVLVEVFAPGAASTLTLRNDDDSEVNVQIRVYKWSQSNGDERLEPTTDVVASPPAAKLAPKTDYVARIVRVNRQPIQAEESYRIIVDQLPQTQGKAPRTVNLLIRQSIPVFFTSRQNANSSVTWSLTYDGARLVVAAQNSGDRRLRIAALKLVDAEGKTVAFGNGLTGYVLSQSTMKWIVPGQGRGFAPSGSVSISAQGDSGPVHAVVPAPVRR
jgi:fimbrial chaperone protein